MHVVVVGAGNSGSALLMNLIAFHEIQKVSVVDRNRSSAIAAIMDAASANPQGAQRCVCADATAIDDGDVVVLTAGTQIEKRGSAKDQLSENIKIQGKLLKGRAFRNNTVVITLASPVDDVTTACQKITGLDPVRVVGFGGDLDRNRLRYLLRARGYTIPDDLVNIVGEHGGRAIPVYPGEQSYASVVAELRSYLGRIVEGAGYARNLATGVLLAGLVRSLCSEKPRKHTVCAFNSGLNMYLTWPWLVSSKGTIEPQPVDLGRRAQEDFERLVETKRYETRLADAQLGA